MSNDEAATALGSTILNPLSSILQASTSSRVRRVLSAALLAQTGYQLGLKVHKWQVDRSTYRITVSQLDNLYDEVASKILGMIPSEKRKALNAVTEFRGSDFPVPEGPEKRRLVRLTYNGSIVQKVTIGGHDVDVHVEEQEPSISGESSSKKWKIEKITFYCRSIEARDAVSAWLQELADARVEERRPRLHVAMAWGGFNNRGNLPQRDIDSVILADGQAERILADIQLFLDTEASYVKLGMPYHRGYLFEGPPRTGKTSIAKALATHFGMDIYFIPLADVEDDTSLMRLVTEVGQHSILLLEDIDTVHGAVSREDEKGHVSTSGLLNALDGVVTPHGLITIMTSNHPDLLDPAVIGAGRVDMREHIGTLEFNQFARLWQMFYGNDGNIFGVPVECPHRLPLGIVPATVVEVFKTHIEDPAGAAIKLKEIFSEHEFPSRDQDRSEDRGRGLVPAPDDGMGARATW